jgi:hypothetical protein
MDRLLTDYLVIARAMPTHAITKTFGDRSRNADARDQRRPLRTLVSEPVDRGSHGKVIDL